MSAAPRFDTLAPPADWGVFDTLRQTWARIPMTADEAREAAVKLNTYARNSGNQHDASRYEARQLPRPSNG